MTLARFRPVWGVKRVVGVGGRTRHHIGLIEWSPMPNDQPSPQKTVGAVLICCESCRGTQNRGNINNQAVGTGSRLQAVSTSSTSAGGGQDSRAALPLLPIVVRMSPVNDPGWSPVAEDDTYRYSAMALSVFWPQAEHGKLIARWPRLATEVGATWEEHRQQIERHCALVERAGHAVNQVSGDVSGLESFLSRPYSLGTLD